MLGQGNPQTLLECLDVDEQSVPSHCAVGGGPSRQRSLVKEGAPDGGRRHLNVFC